MHYVMEFLLIGFAIIGSLIGIMLIGDAIVRAFVNWQPFAILQHTPRLAVHLDR